MKEMELSDHPNFVPENLTKLNITDYVRKANQKLKTELVESQLEVDGMEVKLISSKTGFGGVRLWFVCPKCQRRSGVLYRSLDGLVVCRLCN
jgi:hypothetical protein